MLKSASTVKGENGGAPHTLQLGSLGTDFSPVPEQDDTMTVTVSKLKNRAQHLMKNETAR
jgi:hypothetical protein